MARSSASGQCSFFPSVGCGVDLDNGTISFTLNGQSEEVGLGIIFEDIHEVLMGGIFPCASFNKRESMSFNFGIASTECLNKILHLVNKETENSVMQSKDDGYLNPFGLVTGQPFRFPAPAGYRPVADALLSTATQAWQDEHVHKWPQELQGPQ